MQLKLYTNMSEFMSVNIMFHKRFYVRWSEKNRKEVLKGDSKSLFYVSKRLIFHYANIRDLRSEHLRPLYNFLAYTYALKL